MKLYDVIRKEKDESEKLALREEETLQEPPEVSHARFVLTPRRLFRVGIVILALVSIYLIGLQLVKTTVVITERRIPFTLSGASLEFTNQTIADTSRLSFQAMVVHTTITREVYGSALTTSNTKATGTVVFFNEYSTAKRTVAKGTTLSGENGKKYITQAAVTVSGYTTENKKKIPGTSDPVAIIAADVGDSYNSPGETLSVSGLPSKTFYARSGAISGGEAGIAHTLTASEKEEAIATLQAQLIERLKRETRAQLPDGFVTFPDLQLPIVNLDSFSYKGGSVRFPATMSGTMVTYLLPRGLLEQAIAAKALRENAYPTVVVPDLEDLTFDMRTAIPTDPTVVPDAITVTVSGSGTVITKVPVDQVKERLLGKPRSVFTEALADIPEIDTARYRMAPFWSFRFPEKWTRIEIVTK